MKAGIVIHIHLLRVRIVFGPRSSYSFNVYRIVCTTLGICLRLRELIHLIWPCRYEGIDDRIQEKVGFQAGNSLYLMDNHRSLFHYPQNHCELIP